MVPGMDINTITPAGSTHRLRGARATLEHQWERLQNDPGSIATARGWSITTIPFNDLNDLLALAGYGGGDGEDVLRGLLSRAAHDELAATMVLRRILPGIVAANRRRPRRLSAEEGMRELLAAAWITIRTYDPTRRPSNLAAALIDGARYRAFQAEQRRHDRHPELPNESLDRRPEPMTDDDLLDVRQLLIDARRRGFNPDDLELIRRVVTGTSTAELADELGVTPRAVRYRCSRIAGELSVIARAG